MIFRHFSWTLKFREPFGACPTGSQITIRVEAEDVYNVRLRSFYRNTEDYHPMIPSEAYPGMLEYSFKLPIRPDLFWYNFIFESNGKTYYYGVKEEGIGGEGTISRTPPPSFQITLYDRKRTLPEWYSGGIIYQIFPDRFNKGDFPNAKHPKKSMIHGDWYDTPHYFRDSDGSIEYFDFFGGNLQGIIDKLDYLESLNISVIYLNPIFESSSNHKYDTADYMNISPDFGDFKTFKKLCSEAKKRGMHIILDGVFSHTGDDSIYFNKYNRYPSVGAYQSKNSPYYHWYRFSNYPDEYECWWGVKSMPNVEEHHITYQNFIYGSDHSVIRHWIKAGASGWRLDVADELPDSFIVGIKEALLEEKEDAILIGEVWEDASRKIAYGELRHYFSGHELDAVMNYPFRDAFINFVLGNYSATKVMRLMMSLYENYPREQFMAGMNLIGSHDRMRILSILGEAGTNLTEKEKENYNLSTSQYELGKKRLKLLSLLQMCFPGVPCIYYGDEAGVEGYEDPHNRRTYPWGKEDQEIILWYKTITALRSHENALRFGDFNPIFFNDDIFVFYRVYENETILCLFNRNTTMYHTYPQPSQNFKWQLGLNLLSGHPEKIDNILIEPLSFKLYKLREFEYINSDPS